MNTDPAPLRVARHHGEMILDLGTPDRRAVVITPSGWHVQPACPIQFRRTALTGPLPEPSRHGGGLEQLHALLNLADADVRLLTGWLIAALIPDIEHPILTLTGAPGTGKSTCARLLGALLDPSSAPLRTTPRSTGDWIVQARASWTMTFDNISSIPPWLSDLLCRAVTGDTLVRRGLHEDELEVIDLRRVLTLTTIEPDLALLRGDLADRLLPMDLTPIPADQRRTVSDLERAFAAAQPAILGTLLNLTGAVLAALPTVRLERLPRLADFAMILAALDQVTGWDTLPHYLALLDEHADSSGSIRRADGFVDAVVSLIQHHGTWHGTTAELLDALSSETNCPNSALPGPAAVTQALRRTGPLLRQRGIDLDFPRVRHHDGTRRTILLTHQPE